MQPGDAPFEYRFKVPADEPPGLYWYHPHMHGFSKAQVLGLANAGDDLVTCVRQARQAGLADQMRIACLLMLLPDVHRRRRFVKSDRGAIKVRTGGAEDVGRSRRRHGQYGDGFGAAGQRSFD